jgi:DNA invertase Pin-like site-specific DNA recombinase
MKTAYSYIRFSTPEQAMGDSERRQLAAAERWCTSHGYKLADTFADKGLSGYHDKNYANGALGRLLKIVRPGDIILVEDSDRFSRIDPLDALTRLRTVVQKDVDIVFLRTGQRVTRENFGDMSIIVPNFFGSLLANQESKKKAERVAASWAARKAGVLAGKAPRQSAACWLTWNEQTGKPTIIEAKAITVRRIFALACSGLGVLEICRQLRGTPPISRSSHGTWNPTTVKRILSSRAATGHYVQLEPPVANIWPPIVSEETWAIAQSKLGFAKRQTMKKGVTVNLLIGLVKCSRCGLPIVSHGKRLRCSGATKGRSDCTFAGAPHVLIETAVLDFLGQSDTLRPLLAVKVAGASKMEELSAQLEDCQRKVSRFKRLIDGDSEPSPTVYLLLKETESKAKVLAAEIETERARISGTSPASANYSAFLDSLADKAQDRG